MGWGPAIAMVASAVIGAGSAIYSSNKQSKAIKRAEVASREAAKRNVAVTASAQTVEKKTSEQGEANEQSRQSARRRRQGYASSVNDGVLASSLTGNKNILGG